MFCDLSNLPNIEHRMKDEMEKIFAKFSPCWRLSFFLSCKYRHVGENCDSVSQFSFQYDNGVTVARPTPNFFVDSRENWKYMIVNNLWFDVDSRENKNLSLL